MIPPRQRILERVDELRHAAVGYGQEWRLSSDVHDELAGWHTANMRAVWPDFEDDSPLAVLYGRPVVVLADLPPNSILLRESSPTS